MIQSTHYYMQCICALQNMFASSSSQLGKRLNAWLSSTFLYITSIIYTAAVLINFFGCVWYWVARREGLPNSWLTQVGQCSCFSCPQRVLAGDAWNAFAEWRPLTDVAAAVAGDLCFPSWAVSLQLLHWTLLRATLSNCCCQRNNC